MFNMKTSDLFKRAKQLADLEGSDFISWNEAINCINESNVGLYEKLINMGDNSFVKSYRTTKEEEELPEDFWQLKGVFLWNNGNLQTINRRADNNGTHHLSYELRNGKLYLYGKPNDVLVEYFPKPEKLYFPPSEIAIDLPMIEGRLYVDCFEHNFLLLDNEMRDNVEVEVFKVYNYDTKEIYELATVPMTSSSSRDVFKFSRIIKDYAILWSAEEYEYEGQTVVGTVARIYDLNTGFVTRINYTTEREIQGCGFVITENYDVYIYINNSIYSFNITQDGVLVKTLVKELEDNFLRTVYFFATSNDDLNDFYFISDRMSGVEYYINGLYHNKTLILDSINHHVCRLYYHKEKCYYLQNNVYISDGFMFGYGYIENDSIKPISKSVPFPVGLIGLNERTGYGICVNRRGTFFILPYCEDTPLNYPNSTYFQIISYILAIAFKSKQGADITLLQNQLAKIEQTFEETLGSDAFQFPRMGNVYN